MKFSINKISKPGTHPESQRALAACGKKKKKKKKKKNRVTGVV